MKILRIFSLLLPILLAMESWGQFNPPNPPEPSAPVAKYKLQVTCMPTDGGSVSTNAGDYEPGKSVTLTAYPQSNFMFLRWETESGDSLSSKRSGFVFTMPEHNVRLIARFKYTPQSPGEPSVAPKYAQVNIKTTPEGAGTIYGGGKFLVGSTVDIYVTGISKGFIFNNFTSGDEVISTSSSLRYVVKEKGNDIIANFSFNPENPEEPKKPDLTKKYNLSCKALPSEGGYCDISTTSLAPGEKIDLYCNPKTGFVFNNWTDDEGTILSFSPYMQYEMPNRNVTVIANFKFSPNNPGEPADGGIKRNLIYGSRRTVIPGGEILYDILLENIDPMKGINVDIAFPDGFEADFSRIQLGERCSAHTISSQSVDQATQRIFVEGVKEISGGSGAVIHIPVKIPANVETGISHIVTLSKGVSFKVNGSQEPLNTAAGILKIADSEIVLPDSPDFKISDLKVTPATIMPGEPLELGWTVVNSGNIASTGGWRETIWLVAANGKQSCIGTLFCDSEGLEVEEKVSRVATIVVPDIPGVDGELNVMVNLIPYVSSGEIEQLQLNNSEITDNSPVNLGKRLILELPQKAVEGTDGVLRCLLTRSGNRGESETFTLTRKGADERIKMPETVRILKDQSGAYFNILLADNDNLDDESVLLVTASGNGYKQVTSETVIEDNEYPDIELSFGDVKLVEGETVKLLVTIPRITPNDLNVSLSCDNPGRFIFPAQILIPAGESSAEADITALDNEVIEGMADVSFFATATSYGKGEAWIDLYDNDMPVLDLRLSQSEVSEAAGAKAIRGVLTRTSNKNIRVIVLFSDDNPNLLSYNKKIVMEKGVDQVDFNIGIIDNAFHEEDREVNLTAAVFLQTCSCSASSESGGSVTKAIRIIDNDGPSISLEVDNATLRKDDRTTEMKVKLNTKSPNSVPVSLYADKAGLLNIPEKVVIPAGESECEIMIEAPEGSFRGSEEMVAIFAETEGYSKGTAMILISDRTLPDARVKIELVGEDGEFFPSGFVNVKTSVTNTGNAPLPDAVPVDFFLTSSGEIVLTIHTTKVLQPGESEEQTVSLRLPDIPKLYTLSAYVNDISGFEELTKTNNSSESIPILVKSPFTPSVEVSPKVANVNEIVNVYGRASNFGKEIEVYYISQGIRQTVKTIPNETGDFSVEIIPVFPGDYKVGVCIPGEDKAEEFASFSAVGINSSGFGYLTFDLVVGTENSKTFKLSNPSSHEIKDVKIEIEDVPANCEVALSPLASIGANESVDVVVTVKAKGVTNGTEWETFPIKITSAHGDEIEKIIYYYGRPTSGRIISSVNSLNTTMTIGEPRVYSLTIGNNGSGDTGDITLLLPPFMQTGTPTTLPSLSPGETQELNIVLSASPEMQLNVPIHGTIGINCAHGSGLSLPFTVEPVSDREGILVVDVKDEYTFYTQEAPHVSEADVIISHPVSGKLIAKGKTDSAGLYSITLPEGYYVLEISAQKHGVHKANIQIDPGKENEYPVFLPFEAITYSWNVEETTVDDEYEVVTTVEFETRVPKPVVLVEFPQLKYRNQLAYITVTNKGLITATNIDVVTPEANEIVKMEVVGDNNIAELLPGEKKMIPVMVTVPQEGLYDDFELTVNSYSYTADYKGSDERTQRVKSSRDGGSSGCVSVPCKVIVDDPDCDPLTGEPIYGKKKTIDGTYHTGNCKSYQLPSGIGSPDFSGWGGDAGGPGTPGSPGGGGGGSTSHISTYWQDRLRTFLMTGCASDCEKALAEALAACKDAVAGCTGMDVVPEIVNCGKGLYDNCRPSKIESIHSSVSCGTSAAGCIPPLGCPASVAECMNKALEAFRKCMELYKHRKSTGSLARSVRGADEMSEEERIIEAKEKRVNTVALYYEYQDLIKKNILNLVGAGRWERISNKDLQQMLSYVRDNCDSRGYLSSSDKLVGKPESVDLETYEKFIERFNNSVRYELTGEKSENMVDFSLMSELASRAGEIEEEITAMGYPSLEAFAEEAVADIAKYEKMSEEPSTGVCASVTLKFSQTLVLARQAFRGTLSVTNGNEEVAMTDVKLKMKVRDQEGNLVGEREFAISVEKLTGFAGEAELGAPWRLEGNSTGEVSILFIPSKYAAPVTSMVYGFGGVLSYIDPFTGAEVTRELAPIDMTVAPTPILDLDYFMQRDVIGDDPMTEEVVEDSEPAEFALLIRNRGYGDAKNLRMTTCQPQIVENTRGLAIDFKIVGSALNGVVSSLPIGEKIPTNFGDLAASQSTYAQWWLRSSLMGHFTSYNVSATQVSVYGSEDMSLLENVRIHELIHGMTIDGIDSSFRGFLVNDIDDTESVPDMLWFSSTGECVEVVPIEKASISDVTETSCRLDIGATPDWGYGKLPAAWDDTRKVIGVLRLSDGVELPADNVWSSSVTLRNSTNPKHEETLHFAFAPNENPESYILQLEKVCANRLKVSEIHGLPKEDETSLTPVKELEVVFNKDVDVTTFDVDDIEITLNGNVIDLSHCDLSIMNAKDQMSSRDSSDERQFLINTGNATEANGHYTISVKTSGIQDKEGFPGMETFLAGWNQLSDGKVVVVVDVIPAEGGTTNIQKERVNYNSEITLKASPNEGFAFSRWEENGKTVSINETYSFNAKKDRSLVAIFTVGSYSININCDPEKGLLKGGGSGLYTHGQELKLEVLPKDGYSFVHWSDDDGNLVSVDNPYILKVDSDKSLHAVFDSVSTGMVEVGHENGAYVYPTAVRDRIYIGGDFTEILSVNITDVQGIQQYGIYGCTKDHGINVSTFETGIYFIRIETEKGVSVQKIVKI